MQYFERQNDSLIFRLNGETVMVSPWGEDSLRTRAALFNELSDNSPALLSPAKSEPVIELGERQAVITNGKIHAVLSLQDWGDELQISYYNQKGELLLQEIPNGGALFLKARRFQSLPGDSFFLTASFLSNPSEKIYGMGQYQQPYMDMKGMASYGIMPLWEMSISARIRHNGLPAPVNSWTTGSLQATLLLK